MTVRWGVAGPGHIASRFADAMTVVDGGRIVSVASRSMARADDFGDRFDVPNRYGSYEELAADPDVDVVYVATPASRHERDTLLYVDAGKHVLCEKPFALRATQARRMADAARVRGVFLMEAVWSRFLPAYRVLRDVLDEGRIGEVLLVEADFGFRASVGPEHRLFDRALGGGALLDLGIYPLQLCSLVLGPPDRVAAEGVVGSTGVDEHVAAVLHHASGALGVVKASFRVGMACTARISGTDGWIDLPPFMHCPDSLSVSGDRIAAGFEGDGLRFEIEEVQRCIVDGRQESGTMPLAESIALASTMDDVLAQLGVVHPD